MNASIRFLGLLLVLLTLTSCASLGKPTLARSVPQAGCSERAAAMTPPAPPSTNNYLLWALAYTGAVNAYTDSENKRRATADCLDEHRKPKRWWQL